MRILRAWSVALGLCLTVSALTAAAELSENDKHALAEANKFAERGNQFVQSGSLPRAKAEYQRAINIFPRHLDVLYNLAIVCERLNQKNEAIDTYKRYLAIKPEDADVWTQVGVLYDEGNKKADAQAAYEKALAINPNFGRARHNLGVLLEEGGKTRRSAKAPGGVRANCGAHGAAERRRLLQFGVPVSGAGESERRKTAAAKGARRRSEHPVLQQCDGRRLSRRETT